MVEPLLVVDQQDEWPFRRHLRQQAQYGHAHQEPIRHRACFDPECYVQRLTLGCRDRVEVVYQRYAQPMQRSEPELHLGLGACDAHHTAVGRSPRHVLEQRRLADTGFAVHHECAAGAAANILEESVQHTPLSVAADEVAGATGNGHCRKRSDCSLTLYSAATAQRSSRTVHLADSSTAPTGVS